MGVARNSCVPRWLVAALGQVLVALLLVGCSSEGSTTVVSVAASLAEVVEDLGAARPDLGILTNVGGSQALAAQIAAGAPADVFLSANVEQMDVVVATGRPRGQPVVFASNRLVMVVAESNPQGVQDLADLTRDDLVVVLAEPSVPVGGYTAEMLHAAGLLDRVDPASLELSVRDLVGRVAAGDADVGIAYVTDAAAVPGVQAIALPQDLQPEIRYLGIALTPAGDAVIDALTGPAGAEVLLARGFLLP